MGCSLYFFEGKKFSLMSQQHGLCYYLRNTLNILHVLFYMQMFIRTSIQIHLLSDIYKSVGESYFQKVLKNPIFKEAFCCIVKHIVMN